VTDVSLQTSWNRGHNTIEQDSFGILLVDAPFAEDDIDESLEFLPQSVAGQITELSNEEMDSSDATTRVEVETAFEEHQRHKNVEGPCFSAIQQRSKTP